MRDLLNGFGVTGVSEDSAASAEEDSGEIELSLGLSLGGCFGVDPKRKSLLRSSSIAAIVVSGAEEVEKGSLVRTCSLPVEAEEELRKKKSVQTMRRMAAKKRRLEKKGGGRLCGMEEEQANVEMEEKGCVTDWNGGVDFAEARASMGSQGSCSVDAGSMDGAVLQGLKGTTTIETNPSISNCKLTPCQGTNHVITPMSMASISMPTLSGNATTKKVEARSNGLMEQMPCVSARGEGPNGRLIEGFLYKYKKGEEIMIVCICHGRFLTPAEFVRHAGGGDVAYPLKHIVVKTTSPFALL